MTAPAPIQKAVAWLRLAQLPTTNARIAVSLGCIIATALAYLTTGIVATIMGPVVTAAGAVVPRAAWQPSWEWLVFLAGLCGLDIAQFMVKRFSDADYVAAKKGPPATDPGPTP